MNGTRCLLACVQIMEALRDMHDDAEVLHNDLKYILLTQALSRSDIHIIIIDFGKATYTRDHK